MTEAKTGTRTKKPKPVNVVLGPSIFKEVVLIGNAASTDRSRPILTAVQLVAEHGTLTVTATDAYTLATRTWDIDYSGERVDALARAKDLIAFSKMLDGYRDVILTFEPGNRSGFLRVTQGQASVEPSTPAPYLSKLFGEDLDGKYPMFEALFPTTSVPLESIAFDPSKVAKLNRTLKATKYLKFSFTDPHKPIVVTTDLAPTWRGIVMPVRL